MTPPRGRRAVYEVAPTVAPIPIPAAAPVAVAVEGVILDMAITVPVVAAAWEAIVVAPGEPLRPRVEMVAAAVLAEAAPLPHAGAMPASGRRTGGPAGPVAGVRVRCGAWSDRGARRMDRIGEAAEGDGGTGREPATDDPTAPAAEADKETGRERGTGRATEEWGGTE